MSPATLPTLLLLSGAVLQLAFGRFLPKIAKGWMAFLLGLASFIAALVMVPAVAGGTVIESAWFTWDAGIQMAYRIDGLAMLFTLMATGIGTAILLYSIGYMAHESEGTTRFYTLMLVFIAGLVNLVCSANLLMAYLSWEVIGLCSYFLVGFWYRQRAAVDGARKVLIMTHLAGYGLLIGIVLLYVRTGTFIWSDPSLGPAFTTGIAVLMLVAAMAKSVMFPLHTWIPEAMNAPTPVSALLHSACYVKAGVYLVARMYSLAPWNHALGGPMLVIGCLTMIVGALFALVQTDLKRLLAFSTISQLGHIVTLLSLGTNLAIAAALFYTVNHGLFKGTLFLCAGSVQQATGTRDMRQMGGLSSRMPATTRVWLIAAASIVGVPLTNGFVAKWLLFNSALEAGQIAVVMVALVVSILTAFYMLKATSSVFYGNIPDGLRNAKIKEAPLSMRSGMAALGVLCLVFGIAPQLLMQTVVGPAVRSLGFEWNAPVSWLGLLTGTADPHVTVGAIIVLAALLLGFIIYRITRPRIRKTVMVFTGGDQPQADHGVGAADFSEMAGAAFKPLYRVNPDPAYIALWRGVRGTGVALQRAMAPALERHPLVAAGLLALATLVVVWVV